MKAPGDVPADFVLSAYNQNGNLHVGSGLPGGEISLSALTGAPHPDNPAYTIYTVPLGIKNANSDNNEASGVALTNVTDGVVIDFYSADNIAAINPQQGAANLAGVVSENILEHTLTSNTESFQRDIDGNLTFGTTNSGSSTICFDAAVPMETARGLVPCGDLRPGDAVATLDHGHRRIRRAGRILQSSPDSPGRQRDRLRLEKTANLWSRVLSETRNLFRLNTGFMCDRRTNARIKLRPVIPC